MKHSIKDAYVYDLLGLNNTVNIISAKITPNLEEYRLNKDQAAAVLNDFKYKATGYGKERIINYIESGRIIMVNAPGVALPAWAMPLNGDIVAVINVFGKVRINREGHLTYQVKELFGLAVVGYVIRAFYKNEKKLMYNSQFIAALGVAYAKLVSRAIDMMFALNSGDPAHFRVTVFLVTKFFLRRVMEKESSPEQEANNIISIIKYLDLGGSHSDLLSASSEFPEKAFNDFDSFIKALSQFVPVLNRLETNLLIRKMITTYGEKSVLMLESPHYLAAYIISSHYSANLIKDYQVMGSMNPAQIAKIISLLHDLDTADS